MGDNNNKADMMGSRSDMISGKFDPVSKNKIWEEHLIKEAKFEAPITPFQFNAAKVNTVSIKPTQSDPREYERMGKDSHFEEIEDKIKKNFKPPQEKYEFPITESQDIGWFHADAWKNKRGELNSRWYRGKGTTDVTQFADAYCTMAGCSPFVDKTSR